MSIEQDIRDLMAAFQQEQPPAPMIPRGAVVALRRAIIEEEVAETLAALDAGDIVELADGIVDSVVVLVGTAVACGIPFDRIWDAVHRSNMAKADPATGLVIKRADGKVLKPPGWTPPTDEIRRLLNQDGG